MKESKMLKDDFPCEVRSEMSYGTIANAAGEIRQESWTEEKELRDVKR
jgi:hypothetical protein